LQSRKWAGAKPAHPVFSVRQLAISDREYALKKKSPQDQIEIRDFSNWSYFPGTTGNPFDVLLHRYNQLEGLPSLLVALILFGIAFLASGFQWIKSLIVLGFFLLDWLLLYLLPKLNKSYGPPKPVVLALAVLRSLVVWTPDLVNYPLQILGTLLVIYGFWIEPHSIHVTHMILHSPKLDVEQPIRLLHISDLHIERITRREIQLGRLIDQLQPDLILFSGDVLNLSNVDDPEALRQARELLDSWKAPHGIFAVTGSPAVDLPRLIPEIYQDLPVRLLENERVTLYIHNSEIVLSGVSCSHRPFEDEKNLPDLVPNDKFQLLLYHSPDLAPIAAQRGFDLQLSVHTHGGQVRLPLIGALFTGSLYGRRFSAGLYEIGDMTLYITRGIGMEGEGAPRVRLLCPPEIIFWELTSNTPNPYSQNSSKR